VRRPASSAGDRPAAGTAGGQDSSSGTLGRLTQAPHPVLQELLYDPHLRRDRQIDLPHLLAADAAHVLMLCRQRLLPQADAARLLAVNRDLEAQLAAGESLFGAAPGHRGLYFLYEQEFIARLGREVGGAAHLARSRNDLQATVARLRLRLELLDLLARADEMFAQMVAVADRHADTLMSGFTHLQPAQPTSLGHYFAAVLAELLRTAAALADGYPLINRSPMGAAAGFGSELPIDRELVAELLGFDGVVPNSLDAVASRDYSVRVLAGLALLGVTLTRLATDLQTWASGAYGFLDWPDELVSTSSIMPQKRNAFVLETIRGWAIAPVGALTNALLGMKNVPFTNSIEAGGEATAHLWPALERLELALRLTSLLVGNLQVHAERLRSFLAGRQTCMTALADHLVRRHKLAFRTAHEAVGRLARELPPGEPPAALVRQRLLAVLAAAGLGHLELDERELARALDAGEGLLAAVYGGGPAPASVRRQLEELELQRRRLAEEARQRRRALGEAGKGRQAAVEELLAAAGSGAQS
jgi:argininosuccinate lyase